ncbi:MAG: DUF5688 family protein [Lachnospiraceae bacterium]|nr:DUF5688 family protein [Lachnospiraceae bacterium]
MNYDEFRNCLTEEIQANCEKTIVFTNEIVTKANEVLEGLAMRFEGDMTAPTIYPRKLYEDYKNGVPLSKIADAVSASFQMALPEIPPLTIENAEKSISFSLVNKEKNKHLLENCPYKEVHDMAAVPRWHISEEASFIVNNNLMQKLRLTKEEVLEIAQKNTESAAYICQSMDNLLKEMLAVDGMDEDLISGLFPPDLTPFYVISNEKKSDGSCAVLSDSFMQNTAEKLGAEEIYLLPSSRHEMLAADAGLVDDPVELKNMVVDVNSNPDVIRAEDFLSNSIYKYNAKTHSLSMCDSKGLFHDKGASKDDSKQSISRGRG